MNSSEQTANAISPQASKSTPQLAWLGDPAAFSPRLTSTLGRYYETHTLRLDQWHSFWDHKTPPNIAVFGLTQGSLEQLSEIARLATNTGQVAVVVCVGQPEDQALWRALGKYRMPNAFAADAPLAQIEHAIAGAEVTRWLREQSRLRESRLEHLHQTLRSFHMVDMDTGLYNRRYLLANLHERLALAQRYSRELSLVSCVVTNHEELSQRLSADALAEAYESLADVLQLCQRTSDLVARAAENVFTVVLPDTSEEGAEIVTRRLHEAIKASEDIQVELDLAMGCATRDPEDREPIQLLDRAEARAHENHLEL
jgi:diguanylate cyclase (GGDEF)-like protein